MSEDWIPVPEIENVLIILAELSDDPGELQASRGMDLLRRVKAWQGGSVYVFHNPPEAGEILEDVDADMAEKFALAAQMSDDKWEVCRDAFRRVFSRAVVQRVVLVNDDTGQVTPQQINDAFAALEQADYTWAGDWHDRFIVGLRQFDPEIFLDADSPEFDLRKSITRVAHSKSQNISLVDNL